MKISLKDKPAPPTPARDARIDLLGFIGELQKQFADNVKTEVKCRMLERGIDRARADSFEALLVQGTTSTVDPDEFFALFERGKITRAELVSCIKVNRDAALNHLSREQLAAISTEQPASPSLRVTRIKGVEIKLIEAVQAIAAAVAA